jgi:hypothetical protein
VERFGVGVAGQILLAGRPTCGEDKAAVASGNCAGIQATPALDLTATMDDATDEPARRLLEAQGGSMALAGKLENRSPRPVE